MPWQKADPCGRWSNPLPHNLPVPACTGTADGPYLLWGGDRNTCNEDLTTCYKVVKQSPQLLVDSLAEIQKEYYSLCSEDSRKQFFMLMRAEFNTKALDPIRNTTLFFFLNRTCFNGLYRVNKSGLFNVPFGRYETPMICDPNTIFADSELLQKVEILTGDYTQTLNHAQSNSFFYFDPPYRPLNATSSFNDYTKEAFNDLAQKRLKDFCDQVQAAGHYFILHPDYEF